MQIESRIQKLEKRVEPREEWCKTLQYGPKGGAAALEAVDAEAERIRASGFHGMLFILPKKDPPPVLE